MFVKILLEMHRLALLYKSFAMLRGLQSTGGSPKHQSFQLGLHPIAISSRDIVLMRSLEFQDDLDTDLRYTHYRGPRGSLRRCSYDISVYKYENSSVRPIVGSGCLKF